MTVDYDIIEIESICGRHGLNASLIPIFPRILEYVYILVGKTVSNLKGAKNKE